MGQFQLQFRLKKTSPLFLNTQKKTFKHLKFIWLLDDPSKVNLKSREKNKNIS